MMSDYEVTLPDEDKIYDFHVAFHGPEKSKGIHTKGCPHLEMCSNQATRGAHRNMTTHLSPFSALENLFQRLMKVEFGMCM